MKKTLNTFIVQLAIGFPGDYFLHGPCIEIGRIIFIAVLATAFVRIVFPKNTVNIF